MNEVRGGTSLGIADPKADWYPFEDGNPESAELYETLLKKIDEKLKEDDNNYLAGVLWVQGEADVNYLKGEANPSNPEYQKQLQALYDGLATKYDNKFNDLIFVISKLSDYVKRYHPDNNNRQDPDDIQFAQGQVAADNDKVYLLDPDLAFDRYLVTNGLNGEADDLNGQAYDSPFHKDPIHYNELATGIISKAFVEFYNKLQGEDYTNPKEPVFPGHLGTVAVRNIGRGLAGTDGRMDTMYMMYSKKVVHDRFFETHEFAADHLILVKYIDNKWVYDSNKDDVVFLPTETDILLAEVDFGADTITDLSGQKFVIGDVDAGYVRGNLGFQINTWNDKKNDGEVSVTGSEFVGHDDFVF